MKQMFKKLQVCGEFRAGFILFAACATLISESFAVTFQTPMDRAGWMVEGDIFHCEMNHRIEDYGQAVYEKVAGESAKLKINADTPTLKSGSAAIRSRLPIWRRGGQASLLGTAKVNQGGQELVLNSEQTEWVLRELSSGREVYFVRKLWFADGEGGQREEAEVVLSPVNFQDSHAELVQCLSKLLPVNYEQIERSTLYFSPGQNARVPSRALLKNIATYIQADPTVKSVYVDGHTDGEGDRLDNFALSEQRAKDVERVLVGMGLSPDMMVTRWHGERYPVATNRTPQGRQKNRRVTIRLSKEPPVVQTIEKSEESGAAEVESS